ncbi:MAG: class I SAM-dependent RNA methyltransferase [Vicinamibacteria bacterium]|nr:class I SAM-dependent RNA methyltransferase [Vicinamibacteria bacterium]
MSGEILHGKVLRAVNGGYGLLQIDGHTVFARGALKGEEVAVAIKSKRKGVIFGDAVSADTPHAHRREAPCEVAGRCGGCHYQIAGPVAQAEAKKEALEELLGRAHIDLAVSGWTEGPEFGWRSRVELHGARLDEGFTLGFFEERSHRVVPAVSCLQVSVRMRDLINLVIGALSAGGVKAGSVEIAESYAGSGLVLVASDAALTAVLRRHSHELGLSGLALKTSKNEAATIYGDISVENIVGGVPLRHNVMSFFQANRFLTERLLAAVLTAAEAEPNERVVDLFCGVGLFSIPLAKKGRDITAVEWSPVAFDDLGQNAKANGVKIERLPLSVGTALATGLKLKGATTIVDPPRRGLDPLELDAIAAARPNRIIYVSCDPATLVRDILRFATLGYKAISLQAFDMFPTTFHIETLTILERG